MDWWGHTQISHPPQDCSRWTTATFVQSLPRATWVCSPNRRCGGVHLGDVRYVRCIKIFQSREGVPCMLLYVHMFHAFLSCVMIIWDMIYISSIVVLVCELLCQSVELEIYKKWFWHLLQKRGTCRQKEKAGYITYDVLVHNQQNREQWINWINWINMKVTVAVDAGTTIVMRKHWLWLN